MKWLIVIFCLFISISALAQSRDSVYVDSSKLVLQDAIINRSKSLIVVDGMIYKGLLKSIDTASILSVDLLDNPGATNIYGPQGANGVIIIQTIQLGKEYCQRKLGSFSLAYRFYINLNKHDDSGLIYVLDGVVLEGKEDEIIKKLYRVIENVKTVDFVEKFSPALNTNNPKPIIVITTKGKDQ